MADIFTPEHLTKLVDETLSEAHVTSTHAVVGAVDASGAQVVAAFKWKNDRATWELQGVVRHNWAGDTDAQAKIMLQW